jgi:serine/threonine protein kinase
LVIGDLGHVKDVGGNSKSSRSNQTFGTNNYLAPEAHDLRRSNKIDIWSFGCIVYELFQNETFVCQNCQEVFFIAIDLFSNLKTRLENKQDFRHKTWHLTINFLFAN